MMHWNPLTATKNGTRCKTYFYVWRAQQNVDKWQSSRDQNNGSYVFIKLFQVGQLRTCGPPFQIADLSARNRRRKTLKSVQFYYIHVYTYVIRTRTCSHVSVCIFFHQKIWLLHDDCSIESFAFVRKWQQWEKYENLYFAFMWRSTVSRIFFAFAGKHPSASWKK